MNKTTLPNVIHSFFLGIIVLFIYCIPLHIGLAHTSNDHVGNLEINFIDEENEFLFNKNPFVPVIALIKTGTVSADCSSIRFNFEITNQSNSGEVLENVVLTDPALGGIISEPISGDVNNNSLLEIGETWEISLVHNISQIDIDNGQFVNQANVEANVQGQPGVTVNDLSDDDSFFEDNPTVTDLTTCQGDISLIKTGVALAGIDAGPGCNIVLYQFEVANQGAPILENIVLDDPLLGNNLPGPNSGDENNNTFLDPGEIWLYTAIYVIDPIDIENGEVVNQATVTGDIQGQPGATVQDLSDDNSVLEDDPTTINLSSCQPDIAVIKTGAALEGIEQGPGCNLILYEFTVTNEGPEILENVVLNDPLLGGDIAGPISGDDNNDGFLDLNESWIYSAAYNTTQMDIDNGQFVNQATVSANVQGLPDETVQDLSDNNSVLEDDPTVIDLSFCLGADIGLIKVGQAVDIDGDGCIESILYTFTLTNTGGADIDEITLEDELLGGEVPGPIDGSDDNNDGILSVGETWTYEAIYAITQEDIDNAAVVNQAEVNGEIVNTGVIISDLSHDEFLDEDGPTRTPVPNDACTEGSGEIGLIKVGQAVDIDGDGCIESILYTFTLTNTGGVDIDEITLEDELLGGEVPGPIDGSDDNNDGILSVGETWTYEAIYAITQEDIDNAAVVNQAEVNGEIVNTGVIISDLSHDEFLDEDGPSRTPVPNDACTEGSGEIGLIKVGQAVDIDGDGCIESILYTFTLTNTGGVDIDEITLEDELLGGEVPGPIDGSDDNNDGILSVGETWTYEAIYAITQEDIDNAAVVNQAEVNGEIVDSEIGVSDLSHDEFLDEDGPTRTPVPNDSCTEGSGGIGLIKVGQAVDIDGDGCIESILYTFTLTNTGGADIDEITLEDELLGGEVPGPIDGSDDNNDGILSVGETWTYEAIYAITQEDIDNAAVVNQAEVNGEIVDSEIGVSDLSHDEFLDEDGPTRTPVPNDACTEGSGEIGLIKVGQAVDIDGDGCIESILYTFTLTNTGGADIDEITLEDELLGGEVPGPIDGSDDNNDGILSVGETWTYEAIYAITQEDIDNAAVVNQAEVNGEIVDSEIGVSDLSHDEFLDEDGPTRTPVPNDACTEGSGEIGLIKVGQAVDIDGDGCIESILYTFTLTNTGGADIDEITLEDELLGGEVPGPIDGSDDNNDGILSVGETWTYEAIYVITQEDIDNAAVINQAEVNGEILDTEIVVSDLSDDDSLLEGESTTTVVPADACTDGSAEIGLIKEGVVVDVDLDGCVDSIRYTFTLTNLSEVDMDEITLEDELFNGEISGPQTESVAEDGILQANEVWTYSALYPLSQADIDNGEVMNQANVTAEPVGLDFVVFDHSDDDSNLENDSTLTLVPADACPGDGGGGGTPLYGIAVIKVGEAVDADFDGCDDSIDYTFTVMNSGTTDLENVVLSDDMLGGEINGLVATTETEDGILQLGEEWTYTVTYNLTQEDIDGVFVDNQAVVTANLINTNDAIFDNSDDNSYLENDITSINVSAFCEYDGGGTDFQIFNGITPNGDGLNDYFRIQGIENYPNNNVKIFNRWGVQVYQMDSYGQGNNLFYGISEGRATLQKERELPSGTYFYLLTFTSDDNPGEESYSGYLYINRK